MNDTEKLNRKLAEQEALLKVSIELSKAEAVLEALLKCYGLEEKELAGSQGIDFSVNAGNIHMMLVVINDCISEGRKTMDEII